MYRRKPKTRHESWKRCGHAAVSERLQGARTEVCGAPVLTLAIAPTGGVLGGSGTLQPVFVVVSRSSPPAPITCTPESASLVCALEWVANVASAYLSGSTTYVRSPVNPRQQAPPALGR